MELMMIVALVLAIPVILVPVAFIWYLNIGGIIHATHGARTAREKEAATAPRPTS